MTAIKHVLVPTDGSPGALKAAGLAGDLARALGANVSVLMVQDERLILPHAWGAGDYPAAPAAGSMTVEEVRASLEEKVRKDELPATLEAVGQLDSEPRSTLVWGHPSDEICRFAGENDVDLIVIGSHGRSGLKRVLLGSVSHAVVNQAPCPVTVVR